MNRPRRSRVALVEDEVEHLEDGLEAGGELGPAGDLEGDPLLREGPLRANDALRHRRLRDQERPGDLVGRQTAEQPQRERDAPLGREDRVTGGEDEAEQVVSDVVVDRGVELVDRGVAPKVELAPQSSCLRSGRPVSELVDRAILGRGHQPGAGILGNARLRPLLERDDERLLREVLGEAHVADDPGQPRDEPRRLDSPDRVDRAMRVGSRHGYRSHHF